MDYDTTSSYSLTIECMDSNLESNTYAIDVDVIKNQAPVIGSLPGSTSVTEGDAPGKIFGFTATDTDSFGCTLTSTTPAGGPFSVVADGTGMSRYRELLKVSIAKQYVIIPVKTRNGWDESRRYDIVFEMQ